MTDTTRLAALHRKLAELHAEIADELDPTAAHREVKQEKRKQRRRHRPQVERDPDPEIREQTRRLMAGT